MILYLAKYSRLGPTSILWFQIKFFLWIFYFMYYLFRFDFKGSDSETHFHWASENWVQMLHWLEGVVSVPLSAQEGLFRPARFAVSGKGLERRKVLWKRCLGQRWRQSRPTSPKSWICLGREWAGPWQCVSFSVLPTNHWNAKSVVRVSLVQWVVLVWIIALHNNWCSLVHQQKTMQLP